MFCEKLCEIYTIICEFGGTYGNKNFRRKYFWFDTINKIFEKIIVTRTKHLLTRLVKYIYIYIYPFFGLPSRSLILKLADESI